MLAGPLDTIAAHLLAQAAADVEEIILEWLVLDDIAGLEVIAEQILPQI